jgi:hypothetical protein
VHFAKVALPPVADGKNVPVSPLLIDAGVNGGLAALVIETAAPAVN